MFGALLAKNRLASRKELCKVQHGCSLTCAVNFLIRTITKMTTTVTVFPICLACAMRESFEFQFLRALELATY
jgi:hypothetical protein